MSELRDVLNRVPVAFGLRAQGHLPTVEAMLREGFDWTDIGQEIGWDGETAKRFYEIEVAAAASSADTETGE